METYWKSHPFKRTRSHPRAFNKSKGLGGEQDQDEKTPDRKRRNKRKNPQPTTKKKKNPKKKKTTPPTPTKGKRSTGGACLKVKVNKPYLGGTKRGQYHLNLLPKKDLGGEHQPLILTIEGVGGIFGPQEEIRVQLKR